MWESRPIWKIGVLLSSGTLKMRSSVDDVKFDVEYAWTSFVGEYRPQGNPRRTRIHMQNIRNLSNLMNCKIVL